MKMYLIIVLFLALASLSLAQKPSRAPEKAKTFGSSLKRYGKKEQQYFQPAQKSRESVDDLVIQVKTDLVVNDVLVKDQNENVIADLEKDDFVVTEDGTPQKIEIFSSGENASFSRSIVLIIDYSTSQFPYIKNSIEAAKHLIDRLNPNDKMAIVTDDVQLLADFTNDKTLLKKKLDSLNYKGLQLFPSGGKSKQFSALLAVLNEMFTAEDSQQIIIFQTDGDEIGTLKQDNDTPYQISKTTREKQLKYEDEKSFGFSDIREGIERSRATIYSINPGIKFLGFTKQEQLSRAQISLRNLLISVGNKDEAKIRATTKNYYEMEAERQLAGQMAMFKVAELSGGYTSFIEKPEDAENVYSNIFTTIKNRYVFGYYSTNQEQDRKLRNIKIEVRNHPEYIVTGRKSYLPQ